MRDVCNVPGYLPDNQSFQVHHWNPGILETDKARPVANSNSIADITLFRRVFSVALEDILNDISPGPSETFCLFDLSSLFLTLSLSPDRPDQHIFSPCDTAHQRRQLLLNHSVAFLKLPYPCATGHTFIYRLVRKRKLQVSLGKMPDVSHRGSFLHHEGSCS